MKTSNYSVKWKLFFYLSLFVVFILAVLWLFQIVLLDDVYKTIKTTEIKSTAEILKRSINDRDFSDKASKIAYNKDLCIIITDENGRQLLSIDAQNNCAIHKISSQSLYKLYNRAKAGGGSQLSKFKKDAFRGVYVDIENLEENTGSESDECIIYTVIASDSNNNNYVIFLNSTISPVTATVNTLHFQLSILSAVLLLGALVVAFIISRKISAPIIKLNESAKFLVDTNKNPDFSVGGYREIGELSNTLDVAKKELEKNENLRRELIANISHDLRTPLTMISGYAEVMRDIPGENTPENVQIIIDETKRLSSLVSDVLDVSKLQSGTEKLNFETINLSNLLSESLDRYNKLRSEEGYVIRYSFDDVYFVKADKTRLLQAFYNLVNNAINYTGEDKTVTVTLSKSEGNRVRISVSDTGDGIKSEELDNIWDRYYKVDKVHKRATVGSGLGLSIVKSIVEQHSGKTGVISKLGEGSTFYIELDRII